MIKCKSNGEGEVPMPLDPDLEKVLLDHREWLLSVGERGALADLR
jgi:hypothetical protein